MNVKDFKGLVFDKIVGNEDDNELTFYANNGKVYQMYHHQDCCEQVYLEDINGDLDDLIGIPILFAEESTSDENPEGVTMDWQDSFTWTFYRLATMKGWVVLRWYGSSNGYYSEDVDIKEV